MRNGLYKDILQYMRRQKHHLESIIQSLEYSKDSTTMSWDELQSCAHNNDEWSKCTNNWL